MNDQITKILKTKFKNDIFVNKGKRAGGKNTNLSGLSFETKTSSEMHLLEQGFIRVSYPKFYYLYKSYDNKTVIFTQHRNFKSYISEVYNIDVYRYPDEAFIIKYSNGKTIVKILEKKAQSVDGSVETKLWSGPSLKREYELILGLDFIINYTFCVNTFLKNKLTSDKKKYTILNQILQENSINVLYGDDLNYFNNLNKWIYES